MAASFRVFVVLCIVVATVQGAALTAERKSKLTKTAAALDVMRRAVTVEVPTDPLLYPSTNVDNVESVLACFEDELELERYDVNPVCDQGKCSASEGGFTVWSTDDLDNLPEDQQDGFNNAEWTEVAEQSDFVQNKFANKVDGQVQLHEYVHCHWSPDGGTSLWIRLCQHQAQRQYLRGTPYEEVCGTKQIGKDTTLTAPGTGPLVTRCDCTRRCPENNECEVDSCLTLAREHVRCNNCGRECNRCHRRGDRRDWTWEQRIACLEHMMED